MPKIASNASRSILNLLRSATVLLVVTLAVSHKSPAQTPTASFEVSTVKPDNSATGNSQTNWGKGDRFAATNVTIKNLMQYAAFRIAGPRIIGGPKWLDSAHFDIEAKMDPATAAKFNAASEADKRLAIQSMVQGLLADRFQFKSHWEDRELPVYALVVAKGGSKLVPPAHPGQAPGDLIGGDIIKGSNLTLPLLADVMTESVANELGRVVVDRTGLTGAYDIKLRWTSDPASASPDAPPSLFTAVQEQLGLKLESSKAPVHVLVIDRLEMPSEN